MTETPSLEDRVALLETALTEQKTLNLELIELVQRLGEGLGTLTDIVGKML